MITDYGTLKTEIENYSHRDDLTLQLPIFVQSAIAHINKYCRSVYTEARANITVTGQPLGLPDDFLELRLIYKDDNEPMNFVSLNEMRFDDNTLVKENSYSIFGTQLEVSPDITESTDLEIIYYARVPFFVLDTETHDLLINYPMCFLYGAMKELCIYIQDDGRIQLFAELFEAEIQKINQQAEMARYSGTPLQMRTVK